jgi:mono/diheme cytochrome c family protein
MRMRLREAAHPPRRLRRYGRARSRTLVCSATAIAALIAPAPALGGSVPGNPAAGKAIFRANNCGSCHTLKAAGANGAISSNLDKKKASYATIVRVVSNGTTKNALAMPAYKGNLSTKQIQNLAAFVYTSSHH